MSYQQPHIARKFGRTFEPFEALSSASVGYRELGKVKVDCRFRLSQSKWGVLGEAERNAGILYMDLSFDQPKDCRLSSATVFVTLDHDIDADNDVQRRQPVSSSSGNMLQMTNYFGPRQLNGQQKTMNMKSTYRLTPEANVLGYGMGGLGKDVEKVRDVTSRWTFRGQLEPGKDKARRGVRTSTYKTLKWELSENDLDVQSLHSSIIHTGFAFEHDQKPCYLRVEITGKLQRVRHRIKNSLLSFPPIRREDQGETIVRIDLGPQHKSNTRLDSIADGLAMAMEMENYNKIPVEIPDAIRPSFQEVGMQSQAVEAPKPAASLDGVPTAPTSQATGRLDDASTHPMLTAPVAIEEDSLIQDLARAHLSFPHSAATSNPQWRRPVSRSMSSSVTLVDADEQSVGVLEAFRDPQNGLQKVGQAVQAPMKSQKELDDKLEAFLRLSQSPTLLFLISVFARVLDLFGRTQASVSKETHPS